MIQLLEEVRSRGPLDCSDSTISELKLCDKESGDPVRNTEKIVELSAKHLFKQNKK